MWCNRHLSLLVNVQPSLRAWLLELSIMLHLYHLNNSRSFRVVWLLEELKLAYGLEYQLHLIERDQKLFSAQKS